MTFQRTCWRKCHNSNIDNSSNERSCKDTSVSVTTERKPAYNMLPVLKYCCLMQVLVTHCQLNRSESQKLWGIKKSLWAYRDASCPSVGLSLQEAREFCPLSLRATVWTWLMLEEQCCRAGVLRCHPQHSCLTTCMQVQKFLSPSPGQ